VGNLAVAPSAVAGKLASSWIKDAGLQLIEEKVGTPVFIYSEERLLKNIDRIKRSAQAAGLGGRVELHIPFFPNSNPHVLKPLQRMDVGLLVQLPSEYRILRSFGFEKFIVSPGHVGDDEIGFWAQTGCPTFLSSLDEVAYALRIGAPSVSARIDSLDSGKPGIKLGELDRLAGLLDSHQRDLECFEVYCGSGNSCDDMIGIIEALFGIFQKYFPRTRSVNFAGGHGFVYEAWDESEKHFDWNQYFTALRQVVDRMGIPGHVKFLFEPARDVLADIGALLLKVERAVITNPVASIVVTDGSRVLMPSAQLRERRHNVVFLDGQMAETRPPGPGAGTLAALRGRTILRNDYILPGEYWVPQGVGPGSYLLILDVGAYCATQHMEFLNVPPPAEVLVDSAGFPHLITFRGDELDKWRNLLPEKQALR
jgi:diaminopimelate decarboxylase